jgi:large subunit ribosomal protein L10
MVIPLKAGYFFIKELRMATDKKINTVASLTGKIAKAKSIVFADYAGLKHKQLEDLRKNLKKVEAEFVVIKNKLFARALGANADNVKSELTFSTAALFNFKDEAAGIKELLKFFKTANLGKTKGGLLGGQILSSTEVTRLAALPNREVLLGQLAGQLNNPIQGLHYALSWNINKFVWALNAVKNKKSN